MRESLVGPLAGDDRGQETEYALQREGVGRVGRGKERDREKERRGSLDELALAGKEFGSGRSFS